MISLAWLYARSRRSSLRTRTRDRKSTRLNSSHDQISYAVFCLKKKAVELEHATIPTYLYALYSLQPGGNLKIQSLVRSVVWEEMLHMSLACNVLNAIGGSPVIE